MGWVPSSTELCSRLASQGSRHLHPGRTLRRDANRGARISDGKIAIWTRQIISASLGWEGCLGSSNGRRGLHRSARASYPVPSVFATNCQNSDRVCRWLARQAWASNSVLPYLPRGRSGTTRRKKKTSAARPKLAHPSQAPTALRPTWSSLGDLSLAMDRPLSTSTRPTQLSNNALDGEPTLSTDQCHGP